MSYVELHCHSYYSFLEGTSSPQELVLRARELGYEALALTDHDGLHGAMEFAQAASAFSLRSITGAEVTVEGGYHLTLLARDRKGYGNLCRLLSHSHLSNPKGEPRLDFPTLALHSEGLIALSGCKKGEVPRRINEGRHREAEAAAKRYSALFGPQNFYLELQQNLAYGDSPRIRALVELADHLGSGYVATNNVHYPTRKLHRLQDVLVAIRHRTTLDGCHRERRENSEYSLKSPQEMAELFAAYPQALTNTLDIAEQCRFNLVADLDYRFPSFPVPEGHTPGSFLRELCYREAQDRYFPLTRRVTERLEEELAIICHYDLAGYFLIVWDIVRFAHEHGYPARGRGSSVSSLVCYLLGLSHIDPLHYQLSLGRFLNEELQHYPDIDIDFSREGRAELIQHVYRAYGEEYTALVSTIISYRARSAVRDVGKALGIPELDLAKLSGHLAHASVDDLPEILHHLPEFCSRASLPVWRNLVELCQQIEGLPRHLSQHVGGMVIAAQPLVELVPLEKARMPNRVVCQWDKDSCADAGFIKIDLLALGMLSAAEETLDLITKRHGYRPDLSRIPMDDPQVYDMICQGDTMGVFQIESRAQGQVLPRTRPRTLEDLTVQVALIRPGPGVSKGVKAYLEAAKIGQWTYDHPLLEPVLKETKGVIIYQDQVIEVAMALAGFTPGQGEALRRAMSRKRSREAMEALRGQFLQGAAQKGVLPEVAERVFGKVTAFAHYGFPKAHAAAFGLLAYQTAWLRRYYLPELVCSLLNAQPMGFYPPEVVLGDAKRHAVEVLEPDINLSGAPWRIEGEALLTGLRYLKGLSGTIAQQIEQERVRNGPYRSLFDFWQRTYLRREPIENLIAVGAFDFLGLNRRELQWQLGLFYRPLQSQLPLPLPLEQDQVALAAPTPWERTVKDYAILGFSAFAHPMQFARGALGEGVAALNHLYDMPDGMAVVTAGMVVGRQQPSTANGFVFLLLEDEFGLANVIVNPGVAQRYRSTLRTEPFIVVSGEIQQQDGVTNVLAQRLMSLRLPKGLLTPPAHDFR